MRNQKLDERKYSFHLKCDSTLENVTYDLFSAYIDKINWSWVSSNQQLVNLVYIDRRVHGWWTGQDGRLDGAVIAPGGRS